ncbi:leucine aminopeptidase 2, chloroplastic [Fagus crenata]
MVQLWSSGRRSYLCVQFHFLMLQIVLEVSQLSSVGYVATFSTFDSTIFRTRGCEVDRRNVLLEFFYIVIKEEILESPAFLFSYSPSHLFKFHAQRLRPSQGPNILAYAEEFLKIIDLATLTGACRVALGPSIAGVFTPSDDLAKEVIAASEVSGEKLWRMPMEESYWESMKSGVADMVNTGDRSGGAITAALFLKQFVDEKVQWMHIDIAGPVWSDKKRAATGFGISTLVEWVLNNSS